MKRFSKCPLLHGISALVCQALLLGAGANWSFSQVNPARPEGGGGAAAPATATIKEPASTAEGQAGSTSSPLLKEILKLANAGVSQEVIQAYAETTPITTPLAAADVIALKDRGVGDDTIKILLKRGQAPEPVPDQKPEARASAPPATAPLVVASPSARVGLDPESYEFWYYTYAYPRALSLSSQQYPLYLGYPYGSGFNFGFYGPPIRRGYAPFGFPQSHFRGAPRRFHR
jgi:hypothetical protein